MKLDQEYIQELLDYLKTDQLENVFEHSEEDRRLEILDFLEKCMDLGDAANEIATKLIFKHSQLGALTGEKDQK